MMRKPIYIILFLCLFVGNSSYGQEKRDSIKPDWYSSLQFRSIGPAVTSGRIADFAVNPKNPSEYYVAVASGGVWKTTNKGTTYKPIFDGQGSYSIGCVVLDPSNPSTVWVGTGENNNQRSVAYGDGVYKSTDGGRSWKNMGLKTSEHIANIVIHPDNPNIVYVAAYGPVWNEGGERGVYKSTDGGNTWTCVKSVSKYTGCNNLIMDPSNPNILYAAFHQRMRKVFTYIGGGPETAVYKSMDGGENWTKVEGGLPSGDLGRIGIDVSPVDPNYVYAVVEGPEGKAGVYKSVDKGSSWNKMSSVSTSGNYYQELDCSVHDKDKLFLTDTYYKVSTDGGKTFSNLGEINKHIDNHAIYEDPQDPNHLIIGCDGGIYETYDHAGSYDFKENLPVTQFYKVSTDNAMPFYSVHGGTQDNFSLGGPSRSTSKNGLVNSDWYITSTGDGFETQVDQSDPNIIYAQSQYGGLVRFDKKTGEYLSIKPMEAPGEPALRWNWDAPLLISRHSNSRLYFGANKLFVSEDRGNNWKVISDDLSSQTDRNKLQVMGRVWSVDAVAKNQSTDIFGQTTTIAESPINENILWVGTDDGLIHISRNKGQSWEKIENIPGVPAMSYVHQIIASEHNENVAYACFNHHRYGDFKPYVFKTSDGGKTWTAIQSNLPERGSVYTIAEDHVDDDLLFVGTEFSVFFTSDGGLSWNKLSAGLPVIAVRDMEIQRRENDLVLATFGRGFYILDDYTPLRYMKEIAGTEEAKIFPVKPSWIYVERMPLGLRDKGHLGSTYYNAPNPEQGAVITYYLKDEIKSAKKIRQDAEKKALDKNEDTFYPDLDSLRMETIEAEPFLLFTIKNNKGEVVRQIKEKPSKGMHRLVWDHRANDFTPVDNRRRPAPDQLFGGGTQGPLVSDGNYLVSMAIVENGTIRPIGNEVSFECKFLNEGAIKNPDFADNEMVINDALVQLKRLQETNTKLRKANRLLGVLERSIPDIRGDLETIISSVRSAKLEAEELDIALNGDGFLGGLQFETKPGIADRVTSVVYNLNDVTSPVPGSYRKNLEYFKQGFPSLEQSISALLEKVNALIAKAERMGMPPVDR